MVNLADLLATALAGAGQTATFLITQLHGLFGMMPRWMQVFAIAFIFYLDSQVTLPLINDNFLGYLINSITSPVGFKFTSQFGFVLFLASGCVILLLNATEYFKD